MSSSDFISSSLASARSRLDSSPQSETITAQSQVDGLIWSASATVHLNGFVELKIGTGKTITSQSTMLPTAIARLYEEINELRNANQRLEAACRDNNVLCSCGDVGYCEAGPMCGSGG